MNTFTRRDFIQQTAALGGGLGCAAIGGLTGAAGPPEINPAALARLQAKLKGRLVLASDAAYETARRVFYWNPKTEQKPVGIVQCGDEEDAVRAVEFAREFSLEVAVRSGGHSHLAWGSSNGLVIDLSPLKRISVDPERRIVRAQAGVTSGEVARAAGEHGLVPVLGQCPGVGATGVTLGGGLGWLSGLFGASCDNLLSTRLVTADTRTLEVNVETHPDLFWGMRGAGANFGVTTSFEARLQSIDQVFGGDIHFAVSDARTVLRGFRDLMHEAPDGFQATLNLTPGERGIFLSLCHSGEETETEQLLRKIRSIAKPIKEAVRRQPFADLAEKAAATNSGRGPSPTFRDIQTVYRDRITEDIIDIIVDQLAKASPDVILGLSHYMHGEVCRVKPDATAFPHRAAHSVHLRAAFTWSDPKTNEQRLAWGEEWLRLLRPTSDERIYANYQTYETKAGSRSLFGPNYDRLLALKNQYDPTNFFRRNANIAPSRS
ncbi:FAD-binding oxidoreductase [Anatilimnocola sp. NA78]|uniref:FAD-binding oxidoreductase n=1 Tax=Anatilimnocola sp. NA78 TaxID=3415683 RepID=UPI003CE519E6